MKKTLYIFLIIVLVFFLGAITATIVKDVYAENGNVKINLVNTKTDKDYSFRELAAKTTPAVVHISSEYVVKSTPFFPFNDPFFREFFKGFPEELERKNTSLGSGFIFNSEGYIVTNNHVIRNAEKLSVTLEDGREFSEDQVEIIGADERTDIAVIRIKTKENLPYLSFGNSDELQVGDWVMAVGNPFGFDGTVTVGVVSAKNRANLALGSGSPLYQDFIQTDASINPGNSGGPLVDLNANVIGVNTAIVSPSGGNVGIGFAIPSNLVVSIVQQLIDKGMVTRGYLGVYPQELNTQLKNKLGIPENQKGVLIAQVEKNTPADKGGLKDGDVIILYDGKTVDNVNRFRMMIAETPVNKEIEIVVIRDKKERKLKIKIGDLEVAQTKQTEVEKKTDKWLEIEVSNLTKDIKDNLKITIDSGVAITSIGRNSPVASAGIKIGDVIVKIEDMEIKNVDDFNKAKNSFKNKKDILLTVKRGNVSIWVVIENK